MFKEFKEFAMRGNVMDMAIGVILGGAFGKIITSLVHDIIMPGVGLLLGGIDFSNMHVVLKGEGTYETLAAAQEAGAVTLNYGIFVNFIIDFLIVALCIFAVVKGMNHAASRMKKKKVEPVSEEPVLSKDQQLLTEIRDIMKRMK